MNLLCVWWTGNRENPGNAKNQKMNTEPALERILAVFATVKAELAPSFVKLQADFPIVPLTDDIAYLGPCGHYFGMTHFKMEDGVVFVEKVSVKLQNEHGAVLPMEALLPTLLHEFAHVTMDRNAIARHIQEPRTRKEPKTSECNA
jgi:hypothetical protein